MTARHFRLFLLVSVAALLGFATVAVIYRGGRMPPTLCWANWFCATVAVYCAMALADDKQGLRTDRETDKTEL